MTLAKQSIESGQSGEKGLRDTELSTAAAEFDRMLVRGRKYLGLDVTALRMHILLSVYLHEGLSQSHLLQRLDMTSVTALSRNLADLSTWTSSKREGPGLIELRSDPMNLRRKTVHLTRKGKTIVKKIISGP